MRNLKRALSLTLASVMLLGMMVIGTSAAAGYSDVDEDDNVEAIEVLQAIEVMVGDDRGFGPDRPVNRAEMAVVMGLLLNLDYNYYVSTCPFADVSGNYEWARGWVGACAANGIVSGRGEGIYDPAATVTAIEAASMMMRALGYFQNAEDYNDGFVLVTVRQGNQIGLFNGVGSDGSTPMTRNQVAQMALNALRSEMVDFTGTLGVELNGVKVNYRAEYTSRTSTEKKYNAIEGRTSDVASDANHKGQYYVQLGEELYDGKLRLNNSATDAFGRPSRHWEYDGKAIGTYMKKELLDKEWTTEVTGKDLYDLLGADTIKNYDFDITIDGVSIDEKTGTTDNNTVLKTGTNSGAPYFDETYMAKTYKSGIGQTGKGVLTQVFVNADTKEVDVAVINTYLAKATADYSEKKDEAKFDVYALTKTGSGNNTVYYKYADACKDTAKNAEPLSISSDDFAVAADVKKDDIFLVTQANGEIKTVSEPQVLSAVTLNGFSKDSYVVAEGTQYDYNTTVDYDPDTLDDYTSISATQHLKDTQYNVYLDAYGYLAGVEVVDAVKNYIFLTGIDNASSNLKNKTADAAGILMDGTFVEFTMNLTDSEAYWTHGGYKTDAGNKVVSYADGANGAATGKFTEGPLWNTWCTYTVDKNGVYTLKEVKDLANVNGGDKAKAGQWHDASYSSKDIDSKHISLKSATGSNYVYGNNNSVYIVAELESIVSHLGFNDVKTIKMPESDANAKGAVTANVSKVGIISGVDSITTGIDNVNLKTWTATEIEKELKQSTNNNQAYPGNVYTLFGDDGYVIAAVVVGEDDGVSKNLVYSHKSKIKDEFYDPETDEWTWKRDVVFNGAETTLTEKGSSISVLKNLKENVWYEITYKADGTVKDAEYVKYTDAGKRVGSNASYAPLSGPAMTEVTKDSVPGNFVKDIDALEYAINDGKSDATTVYEQVWGKGVDADGVTVNSGTPLAENNAPSLVGNTLFMNTLEKRGFRVKDDVKTVFIQKNDGNGTTEYGTDIGDLEAFLERLNYDTTNASYCFKISAIIDGSHASVVVIHDWNETGATPDGSHGGGSSSGTFTWRSNDSAHNFLNPTYKGATAPSDDDIYNMLVAAGCTDISVDGSKWTFKKSNGMTVSQTIVPKRVITVKLGATEADIEPTDTLDDILTTDKTNTNQFVKWIDQDGNSGNPKTMYTAEDDGTQTFGEGDVIEIADRYVKVTTAIAAPSSNSSAASIAGASLGTMSAALKETVDSDGNTASYLKVGGTYTVDVTLGTVTGSPATLGDTDLAATVATDNGVTFGVTNATVIAGGATASTGQKVPVTITIGGTANGIATIVVALADKT